MSALKSKKRAENAEPYASASTAFGSFKAFLSRIDEAGRQKMTILLIPHTERKVLNLQLSFYALGGILLVACLVFLAFAYSAARFSVAANKLQSRSSDLASTQIKLAAVRDQAGKLLTATKRFQSALSGTLASAGVESADPPAATGDPSAPIPAGVQAQPEVPEAAELGRVADALEGSVDSLGRLGSYLKNQDAVLTDIPTIWPVKGASHIATYFGRNEDPFTGQWRVYDGVDIATDRAGDPVLSAADGKVEATGYDTVLGDFIAIRHGHGFVTKYAHLMAVRVAKGQDVKQGQIIGLLGDTGLTTSPRLLYEVHVGTSAIDPLKFLNLRAASIAAE